MHYNQLKSIVASKKSSITLSSPSASFSVRRERVTPFIEPSFSKIDFPSEKPAILLVSAVGCSGKTTTAHALSYDTQLPILDLSQHKAVGDNTLTGTLTTAYPLDKIGTVLEGLCNGTHGIIIDGIDEGRSKTTEEGFEAFLDDLIKLSKDSSTTSIVIFGRGQVLDSSWCYLADKNANVGLVTIDPFDLKQAKAYIDAQVPNKNVNQLQNYENARDGVLTRLGGAFNASASIKEDAFLNFIGYPPVLDAIGTLLRQEPNYHRVQQDLDWDANGPIETALLIRICDYLMTREHDDKALPNFIDAIVKDADSMTGQQLRQTLYNIDEQCARVLCRALGRPFPIRLINDGALTDRYEAAIETWCPDHPFLHEKRIRNAVFAAAAVANCILSKIPEYQELALEYARTNRQTYHLLYFMDILKKEADVDIRCFNLLMQSCSEFLGIAAEISVEIEGESWEDTTPGEKAAGELSMRVEFPEKQQERTFNFSGRSSNEQVITLGPYLLNAKVTLPCRVELNGRPALDAVGNCSISARCIRVDTPDLIVRGFAHGRRGGDQHEVGLFMDAQRVEGHADAVSLGGNSLEISGCEHGLDYPLAKYFHRKPESVLDAGLRDKYLRLRRILSEFRSHKRGGLARYREKIDHERVLKGQVGQDVLSALVREGILYTDTKFYHVNADRLGSQLGISWQDLRKQKSSAQLEAFLKKVS